MPERILTLRELNRALLARQMLLERASMPVLDAIEKLAGLHAQIPIAPYIGLWSRLNDFQRSDLAALIEGRQVVKAALMRGTLHFFTADDYVRHRPTLAPMLTHFAESIARQRTLEIDLDEMLEAAREFIAEEPRTFKEISAMLSERYPDHDIGAMRHNVRMRIPLVQVPAQDKQWGYPGNPRFALAEQWIGRPLDSEGDLRELVFRYLGAFGPATVADVQAWSNFTGLGEHIEAWRADLCFYRDQQGRELIDLPGLPIPPADTPAPVRFIGDLDNVMFGHQDRTRIIADEYRPVVLKVNAIGSRTILVDGFVRGTWQVEVKKRAAALVITPFEPISPPDRAALIEEGERVLRFVEPDAKSYEVRFSD